MSNISQQPHHLRSSLDRLFQFDAFVSLVFGVSALVAPHFVVSRVAGGYHHATHETLRLYACLRIACGWILWKVRKVDDGHFRRHVCEALLVCYTLQGITIVRAQSTESGIQMLNIAASIVLFGLAAAYGRFRFGAGGNLIKMYELPTSANLH